MQAPKEPQIIPVTKTISQDKCEAIVPIKLLDLFNQINIDDDVEGEANQCLDDAVALDDDYSLGYY
eukprot:scaffold18539_cov56-Attheya_sp.AAC.1